MKLRWAGLAVLLAVGLMATLVNPANAGTTPPTITFANRTAPNAAGWNNTDATVNWDCADEEGGSGVVSPTVSATLTTDGAGQSAQGTCADNAGNTASDTQTGINIDKTAPDSVVGVMSRPPDTADGWYTRPVTINFEGTDGTSGIDSCFSYEYAFPDSANAFSIGSCADVAGNSAIAAKGFKFDMEAPGAAVDSNARFSLPPQFGGSFNTALAGEAITGTASDAGSGVSEVVVQFRWNPEGSIGPLISSPRVTRTATPASPGSTYTTWTVSTEGLVPGGYIVTARAVDGVSRLGNVSLARGYAITGP